VTITLDCVIPVRNNVHYTAGILNNIFACEVKPRKLYIIDNGSTDDTQRVCTEFSKKLLGMEYVRHDHNIGVNPAWNYAFEKSDADHIAVLNNDLILNHDFFDKIISTIEQHPDCAIAQPLNISNPDHVYRKCQQLKVSTVTRKMVGYAFTVSRHLLEIAGPIPKSLVIYCGDQVLFDIAIEEHLPVLLMEHNFIYHYGSVTCKLFNTLPKFFPSEMREFQRLTKERCKRKGKPLPWNAVAWK
jgi:GT2 family glycosyltransferase